MEDSYQNWLKTIPLWCFPSALAQPSTLTSKNKEGPYMTCHDQFLFFNENKKVI